MYDSEGTITASAKSISSTDIDFIIFECRLIIEIEEGIYVGEQAEVNAYKVTCREILKENNAFKENMVTGKEEGTMLSRR